MLEPPEARKRAKQICYRQGKKNKITDIVTSFRRETSNTGLTLRESVSFHPTAAGLMIISISNEPINLGASLWESTWIGRSQVANHTFALDGSLGQGCNVCHPTVTAYSAGQGFSRIPPHSMTTMVLYRGHCNTLFVAGEQWWLVTLGSHEEGHTHSRSSEGVAGIFHPRQMSEPGSRMAG